MKKEIDIYDSHDVSTLSLTDLRSLGYQYLARMEEDKKNLEIVNREIIKRLKV